MNSRLSSWVVALALGSAPFASDAQTHGAAAKTAEVAPAARPEGGASQLSETQWLRHRVEQLEAALAAGDNCAVKPGSARQGGAGAMKASPKAGTGGSGTGSKSMAPMEDKMGGGMMMGDGMKMGGGMPAPAAPAPAKPMGKMDPGPMAPSPQPADPPMGEM